MIYDYSFGVIPVRLHEGLYELYLVQHKEGYWSFPKGHSLELEVPLQTAKRELFEETGLSIDKLVVETPFFEEYQFMHGQKQVYKKVGYFIAFVSGIEVLQQEEVLAGKWVLLERAEEYITYPESKELARKARSLIHALH